MRGGAVSRPRPGASDRGPRRSPKSLEPIGLGRALSRDPGRPSRAAPALPKPPPMAVQTIAFARSALAAEPDHGDTPAELPSGRASFEDALGRETALRRGRERQEPPADERDGEPARPRERV